MPEGEIYDAIDRFRRDLLRLERRSASEIVRVYGEAWKRIKSELERLQTEYEFARSRGEKPGPDWVYQFNRARSFRDQVLQELQSFAQYAEGKVRNDQEEAIRIAEEQSERLTRLALGTPPTGLEINWNRIDRAAVQSILGMTQPDSPLHRLLMSISTDGAQAAEDALVQGMLLGQNPREVARTMRKVLGTALSRALTIARTETLRAHREATRASYQSNSDIVKGWVWHSETGERTCAACWAMHGTEHRPDEILDDHPNGRCAMIPKTRTWAEIGKQYGIDLSDIPDTNPEIEPGISLFERLSEEKQIKILGPAKWQAWKDGKFALADIVGRARSKEWGTHRYERSLKEILNSPRETPKPKPEEFINYTKAKIDAVRKYAAHWADFRKTLTESELFQLREYKRFGFKRMNSALRSGYIFDDTKEIINAFKKAPGLPEHTRLFRGVARDALPKNIEIGDVIVDKGFVSTSLSSSLAREFGGTIIEILAPKGTPGIFMDYFGSSEWEVLLPNKSMFRVVSVESRRIVVEWIGVEK